jgi:hypothetical protein
MKTSAIIGILILVATSFAAVEAYFTQGSFAAALLVGSLIAAFVFTAVNYNSGVMAMATGDETIEVEGPGGSKVRASGFTTAALLIACLLAYAGYLHHTANEAQLARIEVQLTRVFEAMSEQTFVLSLSQAEREKLNITMPESLRKKIRERSQ